jgi:hypothetical protein
LEHQPTLLFVRMWWAWDDFAYSGVKDILEQDKTPVFSI